MVREADGREGCFLACFLDGCVNQIQSVSFFDLKAHNHILVYFGPHRLEVVRFKSL